MEYLKHIKPQDFLIQVRPEINKSKRWTGGIDVHILSSNKNPLLNLDNKQLFNLCCMMASMVPFMEVYPELMEELNEMAKHYQYSNKEKELTITSKEGNVIRVDMKPKGSA